MEDENELSLLEEWDTQESLKSHLKPDRFRVLRGGDESSQRALWNDVPHGFPSGRTEGNVDEPGGVYEKEIAKGAIVSLQRGK